MRMKGYLEHINLGIDSESGEKAILVKSAREFFLLSEEEQYRAWSVVKVASEILERPPVTIYQYAYKGKMPSKIIKKNAFDPAWSDAGQGLQYFKNPGGQESGRSGADIEDSQTVSEPRQLDTKRAKRSTGGAT